MYGNIDWPIPEGAKSPPVWTGAGFQVGDELWPVLSSNIGDSGWSDELGELINLEVAPDRPLGIASRRQALDALAHTASAGEGKTVLEIGCAHGFLLEDIRSAFPGAQLVGSDYALPPLENLAKRLPNIPLIQLDLVNSPLADEMFDAIVMLNVLEHIEDDVAALAQVRRMLKPGGVLVMEVPSSPSLFDDFDRLMGHFRRYTMGDLVGKLKGAGFTIQRRSHLGFFVFPAFWCLVQGRKLFASNETAADTDVLKSRIKVGRKSMLQQMVFSIETACRPYLPMPFGVRCLVTATA